MRKNFLFEINDIITNVKSGKLIVKNRFKLSSGKTKVKYYEYKCLLCGNEDKIKEYHLRDRHGCNVCSNQKVLKGFNDMATTHPEIVKLISNPEDAYLTFAGSKKKINFTCQRCNYSASKAVCDVIRQGLSCSKCSDGISYPEKFLINILSQTNMKFIPQKKFDWSESKKYDFYLPEINCIIETHGEQHYRNTGRGRTLEEEQENDLLKERLAKENHIKKYIVIDCRKSEMNFIKANVLSSELSRIIDISNIDWLECHKYSCSSFVKVSCDLFNNGRNAIYIANKLMLSRKTVIEYLKQGTILKWCDYKPKAQMKKSGFNQGKLSGKKTVQLLENGEFVRIWNSSMEAAKSFGCVGSSTITRVCRGERIKAHGYKWMYKEDYDNMINGNNSIHNDLNKVV